MLGNILAVGLMSMGMGLSDVKDEPQMYAQDEATYSITYNSNEEWNERATEIITYLSENHTSSNQLTITGSMNGTEVNKIYYSTSAERVILKNATTEWNYNNTTQKWILVSDSSEITITNLTISNQEYYEALYEEPPSMGNDIVGTIASGLGIIGALATTFLTGFGHLFYAEGALTPFAIFALVMLGIAVSFAVVKLVLNLIRSNTGA